MPLYNYYCQYLPYIAWTHIELCRGKNLYNIKDKREKIKINIKQTKVTKRSTILFHARSRKTDKNNIFYKYFYSIHSIYEAQSLSLDNIAQTFHFLMLLLLLFQARRGDRCVKEGENKRKTQQKR